MNKTNETRNNISIFEYEYIDDEETNQSSYVLSNQLNQVNSILTIIIIIFGLIGHSLTIFVYSQNRFRRNSSNIYFLCLALNDSAYLIFHFLIQFSSLIDTFEMTCRLINYLRNVLRFTSAYIVVAFTLQRLFIVYSPMSNKFKSKKSAWKTVVSILLISLLSNSYTLFFFELHYEKNCHILKNWEENYFYLTIAFTCIIILLPIIIIFISNSFLIVTILRNNKSKSLQSRKRGVQLKTKTKIDTNNNNKKKENLVQVKPYFLTMNQLINKVTIKANDTQRLTKMLFLISFSYAILNLSYFIAWTFFFRFDKYSSKIEKYINIEHINEYNFYNSAVKICELFSVLNYGIYFYIYFLSGSVFRNQLKYSSK
jgi:hypothetical protein